MSKESFFIPLAFTQDSEPEQIHAALGLTDADYHNASTKIHAAVKANPETYVCDLILDLIRKGELSYQFAAALLISGAIQWWNTVKPGVCAILGDLPSRPE